MGCAASEGLEIRKVAAPHLQALTERISETCHLAVPSETHSLILEVSLSPHPLRAASRPGTMVDLHCSATGKIFLAHSLWESLPALCENGQFVKRTPNTLVTFEELETECRKIKELGYSMDEEEYHEGVRCLAVPVFDAGNKVIAAVCITAARQRFRKPKTLAMRDEALRTAQDIAWDLGYHPVRAR